jgi:hypothetical protein
LLHSVACSLAVSDDVGDGDTSEALALSGCRDSLRSSGSLRSPCGACVVRAPARALALQVRQETLAGPSVCAWWFHQSASIPRPPRPSAAVAPHGANAPAPSAVALAALPYAGTSQPTSRSAGACSPVSRTGARWHSGSGLRERLHAASPPSEPEGRHRARAETRSRAQQREHGEHRRRLGRFEAHGYRLTRVRSWWTRRARPVRSSRTRQAPQRRERSDRSEERSRRHRRREAEGRAGPGRRSGRGLRRGRCRRCQRLAAEGSGGANLAGVAEHHGT